MFSFVSVYSVTNILMISLAIVAVEGVGERMNECNALGHFAQKSMLQA